MYAAGLEYYYALTAKIIAIWDYGESCTYESLGPAVDFVLRPGPCDCWVTLLGYGYCANIF